MKCCRKCNQTKPLKDFHKHKGFRDGHDSVCKVCKSLYHKKTYRPTGRPVGRQKGEFTGPKLSSEEIVVRARKVHGTKYDYSKLVYESPSKKVTIICPIHGEFLQRVADHLRGSGCRHCAYEVRKCPHKLTTKEFIKRANKVHNSRYDYSKVEYLGDAEKVTIICPIHGEFNQAPGMHVRGKQGCPKCNSSRGEKEVAKVLSTFRIAYSTQKQFPDCQFKRLLSFDFYLPDSNTVIEFDGVQHYQPIRFRGMSAKRAQETFELTQKKDRIKDEYCKLHSIRLIRIPYYIQDLESFLKERL